MTTTTKPTYEELAAALKRVCFDDASWGWRTCQVCGQVSNPEGPPHKRTPHTPDCVVARLG